MLTDEQIEEIDTELLSEPQYQRQYQWSPLSAIDTASPNGAGNIEDEVPGEGNPVGPNGGV